MAQAAAAQYRHSGEFSPVLLVLGSVVALLASLPVAWLYALGIYHIPFVFLNLLLTAVFGVALAMILVWVLRGARVRNSRAFTLAALGVTALAFYFHWAAWVSIVMGNADLEVGALDAALQPAALWATVVGINEVGVWGFSDTSVTGGWLWAVWLVEAAIVFLLAVGFGRDQFDDVPYCEACGTWCRKEENVARVTHADPEVVLAALAEKDVAALSGFERVPTDSELGTWFEFDCESCPECGSTNTLDVEFVAAEENEKGEPSRKETPVVQNLLLTREEMASIRDLSPAAPVA